MSSRDLWRTRIGGTFMSSISENTIIEFLTWAGKNENKHVFPEIAKEEATYFINRDEEDYMMEYSFKNMQELQEMLRKYSGLSTDLQMLKKVTVSICQNRYECELSDGGNEDITSLKKSNQGKSMLPEYIYVF